MNERVSPDAPASNVTGSVGPDLAGGPLEAGPHEAGPSDHTTLTDVVDEYRSSGFVADFYAELVDDATAGDPAETDAPSPVGRAVIRCGRCASMLDPRRASIHSMRRLEGASDPADMTAVVATTCPVCGADGTLVLAYGPMAGIADADILLAMRDRRDDDVLPPHQPPKPPTTDSGADASTPGSAADDSPN